MSGWQPRRGHLSLLALAAALASASPAAAQAVVTDIAPDFDPGRDLGTTVSSNAGTHTIDGGTLAGANLFHSFANFSLAQTEIASWVHTAGDPASIANVVNRVTGGNSSFISGTIDSTAIPSAAFWFINPAGVVFGQGAQVNVPAAAHFSTASALRFADGEDFQISTPDGSSLSVSSPIAFGFLGGEGDITFDDVDIRPSELTVTAANIAVANTNLIVGALSLAAVGLDGAEVGLDGSADTDLTGSLSVSAGADVSTIATATSDGHLMVNAGSVSITGGGRFGSFTLDDAMGGNLTISADTIDLDGGSIVAVSGATSTADGGDVLVEARTSISLVNDSLIRSETQSLGVGGDVLVRAPTISSSGSTFSALAFAEGDGGHLRVEASALFDASASSFRASSEGAGATGDIALSGGDIALTDIFIGAEPPPDGARGAVGNISVDAAGLLQIFGGTITTETFGAGDAGDLRLTGADVELNGLSIITSTTNFDPDGAAGNAGSVQIAATDDLLIDLVDIDTAAETFCFDICPSGNGGNITLSGSDTTIFDSNFRSEVFGSGVAGNIDLAAAGTLSLTGVELRSDAFADETDDGETLAGGAAGSISLRGDTIDLTASTISSNTSGGDGGLIQLVGQSSLTLDDTFLLSDSFTVGNAGSIFLSADVVTLRNFTEINTDSFGDGLGGTTQIDADTVAIDRSFISSTAGSTGNAGSVVINAASTATINWSELTSQSTDTGAAGDIVINVGTRPAPGSLTITESLLATDGLADGNAGNVLIDVEGAADIISSTISSGAVNDFVDATMANAGRIEIDGSQSLNIVDSSVSIDNFGSGFGLDVRIDSRNLLIDNSSVSSSTFADGSGGDIFIGSFVADPTETNRVAVTIRNSSISSDTLGSGNASFVFIDGNEVTIEDSFLSSRTEAGGAAGAVEIDVHDGSASISGSTLSSNTSGTGEAGQIDLSADTALIVRNSLLESRSTSQALAGSVFLAAPVIELLEGTQVSVDSAQSGIQGLIGIDADELTIDASTISARAFAGFRNDATYGLIAIDGFSEFAIGQVTIANGSQITTDTTGPGDGGEIDLVGARIDLADSMIQARSLPCTAPGCGSNFQGGLISILTDDLNVFGSDAGNPTAITSSTASGAPAGQIRIFTLGNAQSSSLTLSGGQVELSSQSSAGGGAGSISIELSSLTIEHGARITTTTSDTATGQGGSIDISLSDELLVQTGAKIEADTNFVCLALDCGDQGKGGSISITAGKLTLAGDGFEDSTYIRANSLGDAEAGQISLTVAGDLSVDSFAYVSSDARGNGASGGIQITAGTLALSNQAFVSSDVFGAGNAGNVTATADAITLDFGRISSDAGDFTFGNAGTVTIDAGTLDMLNGQVSSDTGFFSLGAAGDVNVTVNDAARLDLSSIISSNSSGFGPGGDVRVSAAGSLVLLGFSGISSDASGDGGGGNVIVTAPSVILRDASSISSDAFGAGDSGEVSVIGGTIALLDGSNVSSDSLGTGSAVRATVAATGGLTLDDQSYISSDAGGGNGGDVLVTAGTVRLSNGSSISSDVIALSDFSNELDGDAGAVTVEVVGLLEMSGSSSISSNTDFGTTGDSGAVSVSAGDIHLTDSIIASNTFGDGNAFLVQVTAGNSILLDSIDPDLVSIIASDSFGLGDAGFVSVEAPKITLLNGIIASDTIGAGDAQIVSITSDELTLGEMSLISSVSLGSGDGGGVFIDSRSLKLTGGSSIAANAFGTGDAGVVQILADVVSLIDSAIVSESSSNLGGVLDLQIDDTLSLIRSAISTSSSGPGDAGNIFVAANSVILDDGSAIASDATPTSTGRSGFVTLDVADALSLTGGSSISTTSANALAAGDIVISTGNLSIAGSGERNLPTPANARITSSNTGSGDAGTITIEQTASGLASGITLTEGALITTSSANANAGTITIDMAPGTILRLTGTSENAVIDTSGKGGGQVFIGQASQPYAVILNGGSITALGGTDQTMLQINSGFLIRSADRGNRIAIGQGEEVGLEFEDVSSGIVSTSLEVIDASRVLSGACPAARASGQYSQLTKPVVGPYAATARQPDADPPVSASEPPDKLAMLSLDRSCR